MKYDKYKFKFYLNASHSIYINGVLGQKHPHTWEISLDVMQVLDGFVQFNKVEKEIDNLLSKYQDKYINTLEPFTHLNPTLENICEYFKDKCNELTKEMGWLLMNIEISETPTRSYIIDIANVSKADKQIKKSDEVYISADEKDKLIDEFAEEVLNKILESKRV